MSFHHHVLGNGLNLIGEVSTSASSVALGFFVRTGSRDETAEVAGVSHFLEHMVFKGTPRRSAFDVNIDFDRIGASYNAYTSEENTVFYAAVLPEYLPKALDILADILRPSLRGEDFDMEKKVIIEEINMYDDQPSWSVYDHAKKSYFEGHPLANSVLGSEQSITDLQREQMQKYYDRRYVAPNIVVSAAGRFDWEKLKALVNEQCAAWPMGKAPRKNTRAWPGNKTFQVVQRKKTAQEHVMRLSPGPSAESPLRHAADVLATILGDDTGSRLHWALVDPGLADSADISFHDYQGTGAFFTSLSCDPKRTAANLAILDGILLQAMADGVSKAELDQAKTKVLSRIVRASERPMGRMQAIGMAWTYLGTYRSVDDEMRDFEAVDLKKIRQVLDRYPFEQSTTLALGPLSKLPAKKKVKRK